MCVCDEQSICWRILKAVLAKGWVPTPCAHRQLRWRQWWRGIVRSLPKNEYHDHSPWSYRCRAGNSAGLSSCTPAWAKRVAWIHTYWHLITEWILSIHEWGRRIVIQKSLQRRSVILLVVSKVLVENDSIKRHLRILNFIFQATKLENC